MFKKLIISSFAILTMLASGCDNTFILDNTQNELTALFSSKISSKKITGVKNISYNQMRSKR